jgi:hypothetical protein
MSSRSAGSRRSAGSDHTPGRLRGLRRRVAGGATAVVATLGIAAIPAASVGTTAAAAASPAAHFTASGYFDGLGVQPGAIKHVWLIILENKSYDATFTGLNNNTYLWSTLPSQGVLLKNYYGTGHFSQDNYISMAAGQAPQPDVQGDCTFYNNANGSVDTSGSLATNPNFGQWTEAAGPYGYAGKQGASPVASQVGCVYPNSVSTMFNQFDAAGISWKGYAQDLLAGSHSAGGAAACGAPYATPSAITDTSQPNPGSASATDQYVPKHFPFPWFNSLLSNAADCNPAHIANVFDAGNGLYHDLQLPANQVPAFNWISPNNCSDAHDAVCVGNNLSGGFADPNTPNPPVNYTGGLYASDLFLQHIIPQIEASAAYKDGGLIDVTFDEAFPPFTYTGNSFVDSSSVPATFASSVASDSAGQTVNGYTTHSEPAGPNTPLYQTIGGVQTAPGTYPGPGNSAFIDRPSTCLPQTAAGLAPGACVLGGGGGVPGPRTDAGATAALGSSTIEDDPGLTNAGISARDAGRAVTGAGIPAGAFVGKVSEVPATATGPRGTAGGFVYTASFELVDSNGLPLPTTGAVSGITLAAQTAQTDPLFSSTATTAGGGNTGSVLISPYINAGTTSDVYYNHYSWLRTMEDLFGVASTAPGLDGLGHLGYAAQPGLNPFGPDVFNNAPQIAGSTGPTGPGGSTGPAGSTGAAGSSGSTGPAGSTGPIGFPGAQGPPGPRGPRGPRGKSASQAKKTHHKTKTKHKKHSTRSHTHRKA